ncbi:Prefoldin [Pyronema omphalodes]|nr:Prefoldin [Pyronema omphalodes]
MSIPNEALQKLMQDIESKAAFSQQQLQIVREQMALKAREIRVSQLTAQELTKVPQETKTYESVGKMFVREDISDLQTRLKKEEASLKDDIESLKKKQIYLETTFTNATSNLQAILQGGRA